MLTIQRLKQIKLLEETKMDDYDHQIRSHVDCFGSDNSDYLIHRRIMSNYHRGRVNLLIDLIRETEG